MECEVDGSFGVGVGEGMIIYRVVDVLSMNDTTQQVYILSTPCTNHTSKTLIEIANFKPESDHQS